ncbi:MAG: hypothetical protein BECKG1743F_GA0114225_103812, partial [Candidatus Kentron sp. G]
RLLLRLESERKSCAIWYILFCQSPKAISIKEHTNLLVFIVQLLTLQ